MKFYLFITLTLFSGVSQAYIDPGTGSLLLQGLIAAIAAAGATVGIYYQKIKTFFTGKKSDDSNDENDSDT